MVDPAESSLVHSVAFRVTEAQWQKLQKHAQKLGTSIPQLAKAATFEKVGLQVTGRSRGSDGRK